MTRWVVLVVALATVSSATMSSPALAEIEWSYAKEKGRPILRGFSGEYEGDNEFWARCRADRRIEVGLGAHTEIGTGKGEAVALTLASGGKSATVKGQSRKSENFEMTSGTELRANVALADPLFAVLDTGKPITVTGSSVKKQVTWAVTNLKARVATFVKACGP